MYQTKSYRYDIPHSVPVLRPITASEYAEMRSSRMFATISRHPRKMSRKRLLHRDRVVARIPDSDRTLLHTTTRDVTSRIPGRPVTALSVTDTSLAAQRERIAADLQLHRTECARRRNASAQRAALRSPEIAAMNAFAARS
jgi:hypothetical protein